MQCLYSDRQKSCTFFLEFLCPLPGRGRSIFELADLEKSGSWKTVVRYPLCLTSHLPDFDFSRTEREREEEKEHGETNKRPIQGGGGLNTERLCR